MTTLVKNQNHAKFYEFHGELGHTTDECIHLKKQIEEILMARKLSHLIKEIKQNSGTEQPKAAKKGEPSGKDKALAILMIQPWERVARQKITQSFSSNLTIFFPPLDENKGTKGPMIIEVELGGHCIHCMSPSLYNGIIRRPGVRKLQVVLSTAHRMLKLLVERGVITLKSSRLVPLKCALVSRSEGNLSVNKPMVEERIKVAINPEYPKQTVLIGSTLIEEGRNELCGLLQQSLDILAWKPADMTGVPRNLEVYVDDLVIKSRMKDEIVRDIKETFQTLKEINMKLNPKKCTFGIEEGMFLGYKDSTRGLKQKKLCNAKDVSLMMLKRNRLGVHRISKENEIEKCKVNSSCCHMLLI
ncbi:reverse transcriptase domain-containing protein [Tanacetum coccineum]